jgi:hypothetical protein
VKVESDRLREELRERAGCCEPCEQQHGRHH